MPFSFYPDFVKNKERPTAEPTSERYLVFAYMGLGKSTAAMLLDGVADVDKGPYWFYYDEILRPAFEKNGAEALKGNGHLRIEDPQRRKKMMQAVKDAFQNYPVVCVPLEEDTLDLFLEKGTFIPNTKITLIYPPATQEGLNECVERFQKRGSNEGFIHARIGQYFPLLERVKGIMQENIQHIVADIVKNKNLYLSDILLENNFPVKPSPKPEKYPYPAQFANLKDPKVVNRLLVR